MTRWIRVALMTLVACACSCGSCDQFVKDIDSEYGGINRRVTLYSMDGAAIGIWEGDIFVEESESDGLSFLLDGQRTIINGTYLIEELP